jgi:hypothetical protein
LRITHHRLIQSFSNSGARVRVFSPNKSTEHRAGDRSADNKPLRDTMEKYLTGMKRKAERDGDNETNVSLPKAMMRRYEKAYVALGFTVTVSTVGDEEI